MEISPGMSGKKKRDREKDQSCNFIFDVIKRYSPQPVDDITDYNLCNLWFLLGETPSQIKNKVTRHNDSALGWTLIYPHALLLLL